VVVLAVVGAVLSGLFVVVTFCGFFSELSAFVVVVRLVVVVVVRFVVVVVVRFVVVGGRYPSLQHSGSPWYILHSGRHWLLLAACLHSLGQLAGGRVVVGNCIGLQQDMSPLYVWHSGRHFPSLAASLHFLEHSPQQSWSPLYFSHWRGHLPFAASVMQIFSHLGVDVLFVVVVLVGCGVAFLATAQHDGSPLNSSQAGRHFPSCAASLHSSGHFGL